MREEDKKNGLAFQIITSTYLLWTSGSNCKTLQEYSYKTKQTQLYCSRTKWEEPAPNITDGTIVLLKDDSFPPVQSECVITCYPGKDKVNQTV